jgi:hypothetical protein
VPTLLLLPALAASPHSVVARDGAAPQGEWGWGAAGGVETGDGEVQQHGRRDRLRNRSWGRRRVDGGAARGSMDPAESHRAQSTMRSTEGTTCVDPTCRCTFPILRWGDGR